MVSGNDLSVVLVPTSLGLVLACNGEFIEK
jgi:hypothetical protein